MQSTQRANSFDPSSSSPSTSHHKYDVFLSFRGGDTRGNFLEYLYRALCQKGILTFKDDDKLKNGEDIKDGLSQAIEESKFSIVVLSVNYADSSWCLDELVQILKCKRTSGHVVYPVFYHVEPREVRKIIGEFGEGFAKAASGNEGKVEKWKEALSEVANSKGWAYPSTIFENEAKLIDDLVHKIFTESNNAFEIPDKELVGIRDRMVEVIKLLELGSDETRVVGLWGMGGIGKTTLAKAVYEAISSQFEGCSFIENVRELLKKSDGMLALQKHLISDIVKGKKVKITNSVSGMNIITTRVCRMKALIVLDDVDESTELENLVGRLRQFSSGSGIIITTRNQHVLTVCHAHVFSVQELNRLEAKELFISKAFAKGEDTKEKNWSLIDRAVDYAKGVPMGRTEPEWISALNRLRESPDDELQRVLKISFEGLHWTEKEIFLDICCFFKNWDKDQVIKILDACDFEPVVGIDVLVRKSLLTISEDDKFGMHDLVQKMGWSIVEEESRKEPGERSRLWRPNDVKHVLRASPTLAANVAFTPFWRRFCTKTLSKGTQNVTPKWCK